MTADFKRDRARKIVQMWRGRVPLDDICEHVGMNVDDVARILFRAIRPLAFIDIYSRTMGDVMREERRRVEEAIHIAKQGIHLPRERIIDLLPRVTTPGLRARLKSSLAVSHQRQGNLGGAA
jgi:hypothetical protein